jgi:putative transposase
MTKRTRRKIDAALKARIALEALRSDFFSQEVRKMSAPDRRALIDRGAGRPSVRRQCALLGVARSGVYRPPRPANEISCDHVR